MKKIIFLIIILIPSLFSGGIVGAGMGDYKIKLTEEYSIIRSSSESIQIGKYDGEGLWEIIVDGIVEEVDWNDDYIIAKQKNENIEYYSIIDSKTDSFYGMLSYKDFSEKLIEYGIC